MKISAKKLSLLGGLCLAAGISPSVLAATPAGSTSSAANPCAGLAKGQHSTACETYRNQQLLNEQNQLGHQSTTTGHQVTVAGSAMQHSGHILCKASEKDCMNAAQAEASTGISIPPDCQKLISLANAASWTSCATNFNNSAFRIDGYLVPYDGHQAGTGGEVHQLPKVVTSATATAVASGGLAARTNALLAELRGSTSKTSPSSSKSFAQQNTGLLTDPLSKLEMPTASAEGHGLSSVMPR
jgi:hypothetical protein